MLQGALDARVQRVQPVQRQRLGRAEAAARSGIRAVVGEHAVGKRQAAIAGQPVRVGVDELLVEHDMAEQAALIGEADLGPRG